MSKELMTKQPTSFTFKSAALNEASECIARIAREMSESRVELAKVLGNVLTTECYKEDGFKSVADYAEETFGIKRALAYQLAKVGNRFYLNESETAQAAAALLPFSNLAEIAKMNDEDIAAAIESGDISEDSTQAELRELAKGESLSGTVLPRFDIYAGAGLDKAPIANNVTLEDFKDEEQADDMFFAGSLKFTFNEKEYAARRLILEFKPQNATTWMSAFYAVKVQKPKAKGKDKKRVYTQEEVDAMLAELRAEH